MIMGNEWRTNRLPPNWFEGVRFLFVPSPLNEGKNKSTIHLSGKSSCLSLGWTLYLLYYRLRYNGIGRINARLVALFFRLFTNIR